MAQTHPQPSQQHERWLFPNPPSAAAEPVTHQASLNLALQCFGTWFAPVAAQHKLFPSDFRLSKAHRSWLKACSCSSTGSSSKGSRKRARGPTAGKGNGQAYLTGQKVISKASAEAVDGSLSKKAGNSLLALTTRGGATPQLPARGSWRLLPSRAKREQHLTANTTVPFSVRPVCSCGQQFLPWKCSQLWGMQRQQRSPWHEVDGATLGSP